MNNHHSETDVLERTAELEKELAVKNHELEIEAALEKVRAKTMAMHKSSDLLEVIPVLAEQFQLLGFNVHSTNVNTDYHDRDWHLWICNPGYTTYPDQLHIPYFDHPYFNRTLESLARGSDFNSFVFTKEEKDSYLDHVYANSAAKNASDERKKFTYDAPGFAWSVVYLKNTALTIANYDAQPYTEEQNVILRRFGNVFEQTFTRFLDLQKAEAQAREAQIEAALEKVRSRSLAMHKSEELQQVVAVAFERLRELNISMDAANIDIFSESTRDADLWIASPGQEYASCFHLPYVDYLIPATIFNAKEKGDDFFAKTFSFEEKNKYFNYLFEHSDFKHLPDSRKNIMLAAAAYTVSFAFTKSAAISIHNYSDKSFSDEENNILKRFARVFEQAYTRFLDLQKAETQTREAQIEAALEKVRAKVMAMNSSDELNETSLVFGDQLRKLGIDWQFSYFWLIEEDEDDNTFWITWPDKQTSKTTYSLAEADQSFKDCIIAWRNQVKIHNTHVPFENVQEWLDTFERVTADAGGVALEIMKPDNFNKGVYYYDAMIKFGSFGILINRSINQEEQNIQSRFAVEFERAYTRFLDLQKAEAQAKEAQIQLALERVRARTMAMQKSDELPETAAILFEQFKNLGQELMQMTIGIVNEADRVIEFSVTDWSGSGNGVNRAFNLSIEEPTLIKKMYTGWKENKKSIVVDLTGKDLENWINYRNKMSGVTVNSADTSGRRVITSAFFSKGHLSFSTPVMPVTASIQLLERFAQVFDLTYTRFLDLKQAEELARESQIQLALERVRARTMAMQKSDELMEASNLLFQQVQSLGIPVWSCGYNIWEIGEKVSTGWMSTQGAIQPSFRIPLTEHRTFIHMNESRLKAEAFYVEEVSGEELADHYRYMFSLPDFREIATKQLQKGFPLPLSQINHVFNFKHGNLIFLSAEAMPEAWDIFKRFTAVFEQTYTRFLDLQKAEAQARESQIELGLERVRARAMAMQKSDELSELVDTVFKELTKLDFALTWCIINIIDERSMSNMVWAASPDIDKAPDSYHMKFEDYPFHHAMMKGWKERKTKYVYVLEGLEKKVYDKYLFNETEFRKVPEAAQAASSAMEKYVVSFSFSNFGGLQTVGDVPLSDANLDILSRFGKVFDLTYTRFNDLKQAEAQAREAQIEVALERVRSRSMGMQKSEELKEVIQVVYEQFVHLNIHVEHTGFIMDYKERSDMHIWLADKHAVPFQVTIPYFDCAHWNSFNEAKEKGRDFFANKLSFEEKNRFYQDLFKLVRGVPEETLEYYFSCPGLAISTVLLENVGLYIENFSGISYSDEENATLMRFGKVFQQTYTRFLDLQRAEAQARESQVEAALERVRSRSMGMQKSEELREVIQVIYEQFVQLNMRIDGAGFAMDYMESDDFNFWLADSTSAFPYKVHIPYFDHPQFNRYKEAREKGLDFYTSSLTSEERNRFFDHISKYVPIPQELIEAVYGAPGYETSHVVLKNVILYILNFSGLPFSDAENATLMRFGKVFEQTYTRFNDLKQAEAQAREAKIEAALEKVRSRTMAMQRSDELAEVATVLFQQVKALGVPQWTCGFSIFEIDDKEFTWYPGSDDGYTLPPVKIPLTEHPVFISFNESRKRGDELFVYEKEGEFQAGHYRYMQSLPGMGETLQRMLDAGLIFPTFQIDHIANFSHGNLVFITYEHFPEMHDVFKRFAKVFDQTYTRFLDLQKAEAQARDAVKRASVDRVRAEIASMRTTNDLERITPLIWNELTTVGVPFVRCGVFIMDEEKQLVETHLSTPDGKAIASFTSTFSGTKLLTEILPYWQRKEVYKAHWDEAMFLEQAKSLVQQGAITSGEKYLTENRPTDLYLHFLPFLQGMLYAGNTAPLSADALHLMQNLADAFSTAYARYEDFNKLEVAKQQIEKTLVDLKQTQQQLVQSEKMASLGELTAGIAHEIQNPLNFVNNFSDVNKELLEELKEEANKGNIEEIKAIANDVINNEEKINHHGKRADAIVKNMLQHSRSSGATKELTDINKLADEYLRLSYHGLRAKDKSFNADFKTEFDNNVGKINVIPQEMGRVMLNLINNAFYAVNERQKLEGAGYKPTVTISTASIQPPLGGRSVQIKVGDNGGGIPQKNLDKIFQPFFTTKPTGQGTGLGLSLSYDIIKVHGGEIKVETKEGEGSEFVIQLPLT